MSDLAQAFHEALMQIGLTNLAAREIQDQGLDGILSLLMLTENDVKQMVKVKSEVVTKKEAKVKEEAEAMAEADFKVEVELVELSPTSTTLLMNGQSCH